jgi:hypothetical protein
VAQELEHMRLLESIGQNSFGQGISYTVIVFPSGRAYQGHSLNRRGAHTYQRNDSARAICFVGNFEEDMPTSAALNTACLVLGEWRTAGLPSRVTGGHRDVFATSCPGRNLYAALGRITAGGGTLTKEDDVAFTDRIRVTSPANREYAETQEAARVIGDTYFWTSDLYKTVPAMLSAILAAVSEGLDADAVMARVDESVRQATRETISSVVLPALKDVLGDALGADNEEQAEAIVDRLGERLRVVA